MWLSSYPNSPDHYWPDKDTVQYNDLSEMQGSETHWTFRDSGLGQRLSNLDPKTIADLIVRMFGYPNLTFTLRASDFDSKSRTLSLEGKYIPIPSGHNYTSNYHLFNNPEFIVDQDQYAFSNNGQRLVAPVTAGPHVVEVSARSYGIHVNGRSNVKIDGFTITGYAGNLTNYRGGVAIAEFAGFGAPSNIAITDNDITDLAAWSGANVLAVVYSSHVIISGNKIGPTLLGKGIGVAKASNVVIHDNHISHVGWTGIDLYNVDDAAVTFNRIDKLEGTHAAGIAVYLQNQNVLVANNQFEDTALPITVRGNGSPDPQRPNNIAIKNNVITNASADGIASWGAGLFGLTIQGNIVLTSTQKSWGILFNKDMQDVTATDNILDGMAVSPTSGNWVVTRNTLLQQFNPAYFTVPAGNPLDRELRPKVLQALQTPGALPAVVCDIVSPTKNYTRVGIDYYCGKNPGDPNLGR